jgi:hypothetical protein
MIAPPYVTTLNPFDAGGKAVGHKIMSLTDCLIGGGRS